MGNVIAFVPASGGVGASSIAAAVAVRAAAAGRSAVAVDLDRLAGRLDVMFGVEQSGGWRWPDLAEVAGVVDGVGLAAQLPMSCGVSVLSGPDPSAGWWPGVELDAVADVVTGIAAAHDVTVLDLSRDAELLASVALLVDALVVVAGTGVGQLAAASVVVPGMRRVLRGLRSGLGDGVRGGRGSPGEVLEAEPLLPIEPWVVLRGRRVEPELEDLVMDELDAPLAAVVSHDAGLAAEIADGLPPGARGRGSVVRAADSLLMRLVQQEQAA